MTETAGPSTSLSPDFLSRLVAQGTSCGFLYGKPHTRRWLALRSRKSGSAPVGMTNMCTN